MFSVYTCGFAPARLQAHPEAAGVTVLPSPTDRDFVEVALDRLRGDDSPAPLLIHVGSRECTRRVAVLCAAARKEGLRALALTRPTTGLAAAAAILTSLSAAGIARGAAAGILVEQIGSLLPTYAVTGSVGGADLPMVGLTQHLLSWVPGISFCIALDESPVVVTGHLTRTLPPVETDLVVDGDRRYATRLATKLRAATPPHVVETCTLAGGRGTTDGNSWWGSGRYYEQTVVPRDLGELIAVLDARPKVPCVQCGEGVPGICPFCTSREASNE